MISFCFSPGSGCILICALCILLPVSCCLLLHTGFLHRPYQAHLLVGCLHHHAPLWLFQHIPLCDDSCIPPFLVDRDHVCHLGLIQGNFESIISVVFSHCSNIDSFHGFISCCRYILCRYIFSSYMCRYLCSYIFCRCIVGTSSMSCCIHSCDVDVHSCNFWIALFLVWFFIWVINYIAGILYLCTSYMWPPVGVLSIWLLWAWALLSNCVLQCMCLSVYLKNCLFHVHFLWALEQ